MVFHKIYCDHCGKELDTMKDFNDTQIDMAHKWCVVDLCSECLDELYDMVTEFCAKRRSTK